MLDSGGFSEIRIEGDYTYSPENYSIAIDFWAKCGELEAAATMDYPCTRAMSSEQIAANQSKTIENYLAIAEKVESRTYILPVLQGAIAEDYVSHLKAYRKNINLPADWYGVGSLVGRSNNEIAEILLAIKKEAPDLKLHGFGIKSRNLNEALIWHLLYSCDSQSHGLSRRSKTSKYQGSNDPTQALAYYKKVKDLNPSLQLNLFENYLQLVNCSSDKY